MTWGWPLDGGRAWTLTFNSVNHAENKSVPVEASFVAEAFEDVQVKAGTFKAYRVRMANNIGEETVWWFCPDNGLFVKQRLVRSDKSPLGPGTCESELTAFSLPSRRGIRLRACRGQYCGAAQYDGSRLSVGKTPYKSRDRFQLCFQRSSWKPVPIARARFFLQIQRWGHRVVRGSALVTRRSVLQAGDAMRFASEEPGGQYEVLCRLGCIVASDVDLCRRRDAPCCQGRMRLVRGRSDRRLAAEARPDIRDGWPRGRFSGPGALHSRLSELGLPVVCLDARHLKAATSAMPVKTDRIDARNIAMALQAGWYRVVHVKSHSVA